MTNLWKDDTYSKMSWRENWVYSDIMAMQVPQIGNLKFVWILYTD